MHACVLAYAAKESHRYQSLVAAQLLLLLIIIIIMIIVMIIIIIIIKNKVHMAWNLPSRLDPQ